MKAKGKAVAWLCIFSPIIAGCYTSTMIDPAGEDKARIYSGSIEFAVMKDSTKYEFNEPPTIVKDTITGDATAENLYREMSIPLSDIAKVGQTESGATMYVVTKGGETFRFATPAAIVNKSIVGKMRLAGSMRVSLPLADVGEVSVSEYNAAITWIMVGAVAVGLTATALAAVEAVESFGRGF